MLVRCVLFMLCYHLLLGGAVTKFTPTVYPAKTLSSSHCGQDSSLQDHLLIEALQNIQQHLHHSSCISIFNTDPSVSSGYYNISSLNGSTVQVYCDMEGTNCGREGGWTRVVYANMSQPDATCPQGLDKRDFTNGTLCGRNENAIGCNGTVFPTHVEYSQVCGQVRGYQYGVTVAYSIYYMNMSTTIDNAYVSGVSITYGSTPRKHIWTYAAGNDEVFSGRHPYSCPCKQGSPDTTPPFVGNDSYCESGTRRCML